MYPLIFGGAFMAELDLCAAHCCRRLLFDSPACKQAVTHKANFQFHRPSYCGALLDLTAEVVELGEKSIVVEVSAHRNVRNDLELIATARFVFVSLDSSAIPSIDLHTRPTFLPYAKHGLSL